MQALFKRSTTHAHMVYHGLSWFIMVRNFEGRILDISYTASLHSCQLLQIFSNYYEFYQELQKYELLFKNYEFQVFRLTNLTKNLTKMMKYHFTFMSIWVKSRTTIIKIRISTHTEYFRPFSVLNVFTIISIKGVDRYLEVGGRASAVTHPWLIFGRIFQGRRSSG